MSDLPRPTQATVAQLAGVERSTVSHVLSGRPTRISPQVAARIRQAASQLGYTPNRHARALLTGRTRTAGVLLASPWHFQGWVWSRIAIGFQQTFFESGYDVILHGAEAPEILTHAQDLLREQRADGILVLGATRVVLPPRSQPLPVVAVDLGEHHQCPAVSQDPRPGIRQAAEHLRALGHRHLAWLGPELSTENPSKDRDDTLAAFAAETGLQLERLALPLPPRKLGNPTPANLAEIRQAIRAHVNPPPGVTAILCWNDPLAACLCQMLAERGLRVPEDLSVTGFDDLQPSLLSPSLSTVSGAYFEMGAAAAKLLLALIEHRETEPKVPVSTWFIPRESTGPAHPRTP